LTVKCIRRKDYRGILLVIFGESIDVFDKIQREGTITGNKGKFKACQFLSILGVGG
jgi:hypothetical protein